MEELRIGEINTVEAVGTVSEYDLTVKQNKQKCEIDGVETEVKSAIIYGKLIVKVDNDDIEFRVLTNKFTKSGEERKNFKGLCHLAGITYENKDGKVVYSRDNSKLLIPIIKGKSTLLELGQEKEKGDIKEVSKKTDEKATRVIVKGNLDKNLFLNKDQNDIIIGKQLSVTAISTDAPDVDKCSFDIEGYVNNVFDEVDNNGRATGKKFVDLINIGYFGTNVFTFAVPKEWIAEDESGEYTLTSQDFVEACPIGSTITAHGDIEGEVIGKIADTSGKRTFGRGSNVTQGFKRIDWFIKGADIEQSGSVKCYKKEDMEVALKEWDIFLDAEFNKKKKEAEENYKKKQEQESQKSNVSPTRGLGRRSNVSQATSNMESPF